jgi:hypothetical protein
VGPAAWEHGLVGRITGLGWALIAAVLVTVALVLVAPEASVFGGIVCALLLLVAVVDAVGGPTLDHDAAPLGFEQVADDERRRKALRRLSRDRDWDRRAPDAADEPAEAIWARERERRGLR